MDEMAVVDAWLAEALAGVCEGRIFADVAPAGTATPFLVTSVRSAEDETGGVKPRRRGGAARKFTVIEYLIQCVGVGPSYASLYPTMREVERRLAGAWPTDRILNCRRTGEVRYLEHDAGRDYRHVGHVYEIVVAVEPAAEE